MICRKLVKVMESLRFRDILNLFVVENGLIQPLISSPIADTESTMRPGEAVVCLRSHASDLACLMGEP